MSVGALSDIRIIDLTQALAGPYGTMFLADQGADVIKVESPVGDLARHGGPFHTDDEEKSLGAYFQSVNRNKKSIVLDLKTPAGADALKALVKDADAIVENFRCGVMDSLGLSYETLKEINPKLVYGTLRGFGDERTGGSPYVNWPAYDVVAQAMGGMMGVTGEIGGKPTKVGPGVGDTIPGLMLAFGVLSAIHYARQTGKGQFVDVSMLDAVLSVTERIVYQHSVQGMTPGLIGSHHPMVCPFGLFPAKDGYVTLAAPQQSFFEILCDRLEAQELAQDERFMSSESRGRLKHELIPLVGEATSKFTKAELEERLGGVVPFGPVLDAQEISENEHFKRRNMRVSVEQPGAGKDTIIAGVPIKMTETSAEVRVRAPLLGEHSKEVLREAGLSDDEIEMVSALRQMKQF